MVHNAQICSNEIIELAQCERLVVFGQYVGNTAAQKMG